MTSIFYNNNKVVTIFIFMMINYLVVKNQNSSSVYLMNRFAFVVGKLDFFFYI